MQKAQTQKVHVIDSHTGGEPTRIVVDGAPDFGAGALAGRVHRFRERYDWFRTAIVCEPRGSDVLVGGCLLEPSDPGCTAAVIFFNNVGYLGMCGHGTIGLVATLAHMGRIQAGEHRIETPVGTVTARLHSDGRVSVRNVPSYRHRKDAAVEIGGVGTLTGDVAWGGNWFFLVENHGQEIAFSNVEALTDFTWRIRQALAEQAITGRDGAQIDHIELFAESDLPGVQSRNFVLCPGNAYDRSPCGTGTSAKVACLYADGKLKGGEVWRQESILGSLFEATVEEIDGSLFPTITGAAWVNAESVLLLNSADPYCCGFRAQIG